MRTWARYQLTLMHTLFIPEDGGDTLAGHPSRPSFLAARLFTVVINRQFYIGWICRDFTQAFMLARESTFLFCLWLGKVTLFLHIFAFCVTQIVNTSGDSWVSTLKIEKLLPSWLSPHPCQPCSPCFCTEFNVEALLQGAHRNLCESTKGKKESS